MDRDSAGALALMCRRRLHRSARRQRPGRRALHLERLEARQLLATLDGAAAVTFFLQTTDSDGQPISEVGVGDSFFLDVLVQDTRPAPDRPGVFAAYLDLHYDASLVAVKPDHENPLGIDVEFSADYPNGKSGRDNQLGLIDEIGSFQDAYFPLGPAPRRVFRVALAAGEIEPLDDIFHVAEDSLAAVLDVLANDRLRTGTAHFAADPPDIRPEHAVLLFDPPEVVPDAALEFVEADLQITQHSPQGTIQSVTQPDRGGQVVISADGLRLLYTPLPDFFGRETFTYSVVGGGLAEVAIDVQPINDRPVAADDAYTVRHNQTLAVDAAQGVLANDHDVESDPLEAQLVEAPAHGALQLQPDGSFQYVPEPDYRGPDQFTYVAHDGQLPSIPATVHVEVGPPLVSIRLEITDTEGRPLSQVTNDADLVLQTWVQDLRHPDSHTTGVHAAYLDILYDQTTWSPLFDAALPLGFDVLFGAGFLDPGQGDAHTAGIVDDIGSTRQLQEPAGPDEQLLLRMPLHATGPRILADTFRANYQSPPIPLDVLRNERELTWETPFLAAPADNTPESDVLLSVPREAVLTEDIRYTGTSLEVRNDPQLVIFETTPPDQGGSVVIADDGQSVLYSPADGFQGDETFAYSVINARGQTASALVTVAVEPSWQNLHNPLDVNADLAVTPLDALIVINDLSRNQPRPLTDPPAGPPFLDVDGDGSVRPRDALLIINYLSRQSQGEGEAPCCPGRLAASMPWQTLETPRWGLAALDPRHPLGPSHPVDLSHALGAVSARPRWGLATLDPSDPLGPSHPVPSHLPVDFIRPAGSAGGRLELGLYALLYGTDSSGPQAGGPSAAG